MPSAEHYCVVIDTTPESRVALRFAALRASRVGARVRLLHVVAKPEFMQWGAVQEAMEAEALEEAEALLDGCADEAEALAGERPQSHILRGEGGPAILAYLLRQTDVRALVLAAAPKGAPGPLITFFSGERAGTLPCLIIIVPGGTDADRLASLT
jgi:nucleotide-binding universal stress UspA family protein